MYVYQIIVVDDNTCELNCTKLHSCTHSYLNLLSMYNHLKVLKQLCHERLDGMAVRIGGKGQLAFFSKDKVTLVLQKGHSIKSSGYQGNT